MTLLSWPGIGSYHAARLTIIHHAYASQPCKLHALQVPGHLQARDIMKVSMIEVAAMFAYSSTIRMVMPMRGLPRDPSSMLSAA